MQSFPPPFSQQPSQPQPYPAPSNPSQPLAAYPQQPPPSPQLPQTPYPGMQQQQMPQPQVPYPVMPQPGMQPMMQQQAYAPIPPVMQQSVNVNVNMTRGGPGFLMRALYFIFVGWWVGLIWLHIGFAFCAFIVTLPLGLYMLNRLPQVMTLRQSGTSTKVNVSTTSAVMPGATPGAAPGMMQSVNVNVSIGATQQRSFLLRALYYVFIGCWLGYLWALVAYFFCATIVLLPVGIMMFDRLPAVLTLRRN
jgi:uncharacterized membrane protein YccF (DUF307 family)